MNNRKSTQKGIRTSKNKTRRANRTLRIALRAYTERLDQAPTKIVYQKNQEWPRDILIFDTETTTDAEQRLLFGCWRQCRWTRDNRLELIQEGLFHADDLEQMNPSEYKTIKQYANTHNLPLVTRDIFCRRIFYPIAYEARGLVVGFNLPFDLTRISIRWGVTRGTRYGGFSLTLCTTRDTMDNRVLESRWLPRIWLRILSSKQSFIEFASPFELDPINAETVSEQGGRRRLCPFRGHFLDLRTLVFALTSESYSLERACAKYGIQDGKIPITEHGRITPEYIDYNRQDVSATGALLEQVRKEFDAHSVQLDPCKVFSPATLAKAYLRTMGITPPQQKFSDLPRDLYGIAMSAYHGGRAEARIRRLPVPIVHTDFISMYPTVNALIGLWKFVIAERLDVEEWTDQAQEILNNATVDQYFDPAAWQTLHWFALVSPNEDILPVRANYDESQPSQFNIGVNYFTSEQPIWYAGPDLIAAALLGRKAPRIIRAIRMLPQGIQSGLNTITLPSGTAIDPTEGDFFRAIVEQRKFLQRDKACPENTVAAQALKILANAGSYGISAECIPEELPKDKTARIRVYGGFEPFECNVRSPETPGSFNFPPFAALITASARLMLALLERTVTDAGGIYGFCDTDSMAIVSTENGGVLRSRDDEATPIPEVHALPWKTVRAIVNRFCSLNPYSQDIVPGSILEIKDVSITTEGEMQSVSLFAISAKRYTFFRLNNPDNIEIIDPSEHGLGHLLNPYTAPKNKHGSNKERSSWISKVWAMFVQSALGLPVKPLDFADLPAVTRLAITTPHVLRNLGGKGSTDPGPIGARPASFLLSASVSLFGHPVGFPPQKFHIVAPYSSNPKDWLTGPWIDVHSGHDFRVTTKYEDLDSYSVRVRTFGDVIDEYASHSEYKSADAEHLPCTRTTYGVLYRRYVVADSIIHIGKEANRLEEVQNGIVHNWDDIVLTFSDPKYDLWSVRIRPLLSQMRTGEIASIGGVSERAARNLRKGRSRPKKNTLNRFHEWYKVNHGIKQ